MKKYLAIFLAIIMLVSMAACSSDNPVILDSIPDNSKADPSTTDSKDSEEIVFYEDKTYIVGKDLPAGTYIITCTDTKYGMEVTIFTSQSNYNSFLNAERYTNGEYRNAVEANAWTDFYLHKDEKGFIRLEEGNVILLDDGLCAFSKYDPMSENILYDGVYIVGKDVLAKSMNIKSLSGIEVAVFQNKEQYLKYYKSNRWSGADETNAIEKNSLSNKYLYTGYSTSVNLEEGMILLISDGEGQYTIDNGPVIN